VVNMTEQRLTEQELKGLGKRQKLHRGRGQLRELLRERMAMLDAVMRRDKTDIQFETQNSTGRRGRE